jgi:predicted membrane protein
LLIGVNSALMTVFGDQVFLIPGALITGLLADLLYMYLRPSLQNVQGLRIFAFTVPTIFYLLYFGSLALTRGVTWSIHLWLGSSFLAGVVGLFISYLLLAPTSPDNETR